MSVLESFVEDKDPMIGRRLGSYRIEREIGRGGMGAVYEASRADNEFNKRAAIKLVKRGMDTDFILRRFRKERQILAALDHPHIAGLLDGGTTEDGLPYFVMEFIEGQPLYSYCDNNKLNITERLKLFRSICDAVHYAHQKQVVPSRHQTIERTRNFRRYTETARLRYREVAQSATRGRHHSRSDRDCDAFDDAGVRVAGTSARRADHADYRRLFTRRVALRIA